MTNYKTFFRVALLVICQYSAVCNGTRCYQCGTEAILTDIPSDYRDPNLQNVLLLQESCESFENSFSYAPFVIFCGEGQVCFKMSMASPNGVLNTVRSCGYTNNSQGQEYTMNCGQMRSPSSADISYHDQDQDHICICDTDYCNSTTVIYSKLLILLLTTIITKLL